LTDPLGHTVHYYVDETEFDCGQVDAIDFDRIAYVKILESDFLMSAKPSFGLVSVGGPNGLAVPMQQTSINVLIYTRKGSDFRSMRGGMNSISVKGFDRPLPFTPNDRTLYWSPWLRTDQHRVQFPATGGCRQVRIKISGISPTGRTLFYEDVITLKERPVSQDMLQAGAGKNKPSEARQQVLQVSTVGLAEQGRGTFPQGQGQSAGQRNDNK
jgi:hypothetical protein